MHDGSLLLHLLHAALMASSMMLTWQVHRLSKR
jgi:cytochrome oxidase assembly protein ShyY1